MLDNYLIVAKQVLILFILIGVGVICAKAKLLTREAVKSLANVVLIFATPCVIIRSFAQDPTPERLQNLGYAALASLGVHLLGIGLVHLLIRDKDRARRCVLQYGAVFSNAGYMALPLQQAILGNDGVFYGSVYVAVFNLVMWTYGVAIMSGGAKSLSPRKILLNPGVIGVVLGLAVLFFFGSEFNGDALPLLYAPINHIANLNTPLPMLIIGFYLANAPIMKALKDKSSYLTIVLRLAVIPLLSLGGLWLCGLRGTVLVSVVIGASAPVATATTMLATRYERDTDLSVNIVVLSTLLSILTMPLIVGLAQTL